MESLPIGPHGLAQRTPSLLVEFVLGGKLGVDRRWRTFACIEAGAKRGPPDTICAAIVALSQPPREDTLLEIGRTGTDRPMH